MPTTRPAVIVVLLSLGSLGGCTHTRASAPTTTTARPGDTPSAVRASGVRTELGGRGLLVTFVGGSPYDQADACSIDYTAHAAETDTSVGLRFTERHPPVTLAPGTGCTDIGFFRTVHVRLAKPIGRRLVVDQGSATTFTPFDGATLFTVPGWTLQREQPGQAEVDANSWIRTWTSAACTIEVQQSPHQGDDRAPPIVPMRAVGVDLRGHNGVYWPLEQDNGPVVGWPEGKQWIVVRAVRPCAMDKDRLLALAESLRRP